MHSKISAHVGSAVSSNFEKKKLLLAMHNQKDVDRDRQMITVTLAVN